MHIEVSSINSPAFDARVLFLSILIFSNVGGMREGPGIKNAVGCGTEAGIRDYPGYGMKKAWRDGDWWGAR